MLLMNESKRTRRNFSKVIERWLRRSRITVRKKRIILEDGITMEKILLHIQELLLKIICTNGKKIRKI